MLLKRVVGGELPDEMTLNRGLSKSNEGATHTCMPGKNIPGRAGQQRKVPESGACSVCLRPPEAAGWLKDERFHFTL